MKPDNPLLDTEVTCCECGEVETLHWNEGKNERLTELALCFSCDFWLSRIERHATDPLSAVIDGSAYIVNPFDTSNRPAHCRGFGGSQITVVWADGRKATTNDLWCQGQIPDRFRDRLRGNAAWVR